MQVGVSANQGNEEEDEASLAGAGKGGTMLAAKTGCSDWLGWILLESCVSRFKVNVQGIAVLLLRLVEVSD